VLAVFSADSPKAHTLLADSMGIPWVQDKDGRYQLLLRAALEHGHDAILLYDRDYKVKFQALAAPDNDVVRQLVEKYLLGTITYSPASLLSSNLIGKRVEGLQCISAHPPRRGVFVVFPPGCSSCELNGYKKFLKRAHDAGWGSTAPADKWTIVFANGFDAHVLASMKDVGFDILDICGVREDKLLDPYQTRQGLAAVPVLLKAGEDGIVSKVEGLTAVSTGGEK
jgi:hypothetical protein